MKKIKLTLVEVLYGHRCNLSCSGCSSISDQIKDYNQDPTIESIFESIDNLSNTVIPDSIDLMGGELFLYWDKIKQIVPKIREKFPTTTITMTTNGMLLEKYQDEVVDLCKAYGPCVLEVTNHFTLFPQDTMTLNYKKKIDNFIEKNNFAPDTHHIVEFKTAKDQTFENADLNIEVTITNPITFYPGYQTINSQVKPFATNDPEGSYRNGCAMPICHMLVDSKLYKCSWLAFLPKLLAKHGQLDDPDWTKYLEYQPVDLAAPSEQALADFEATRHSAISVCDMCSNNVKHHISHNRSTVLP
jgi:organic radical activating enzyme